MDGSTKYRHREIACCSLFLKLYSRNRVSTKRQNLRLGPENAVAPGDPGSLVASAGFHDTGRLFVPCLRSMSALAEMMRSFSFEVVHSIEARLPGPIQESSLVRHADGHLWGWRVRGDTFEDV